MKPNTRTALLAVIDYWKSAKADRAAAPPPIPANDALCVRFHPPTCEVAGEKCPVYQATGFPGCRETPYRATADAFFALGFEQWQAAAETQIKFLESLLTKEKQ